MAKQIFFLTLFISAFTGYNNTVKGQTYSVESFEGRKIKISLIDTLPSRVLAVIALNDTIFLNDYMNTKEVHVLHDRFLEITYETNAGSNVDLENTLILTVKNGKINVSMLVTSYIAFEAIGKQGIYKLKFNITGNNENNYRLVVNAHDKQKSIKKPRDTYERDKQIVLSYDASQNIFYGRNAEISKYFKINDPKTKKQVRQHIKATCRVITFRNNNYYHINGKWYTVGDNNELFGDYYR